MCARFCLRRLFHLMGAWGVEPRPFCIATGYPPQRHCTQDVDPILFIKWFASIALRGYRAVWLLRLSNLFAFLRAHICAFRSLISESRVVRWLFWLWHTWHANVTIVVAL